MNIGTTEAAARWDRFADEYARNHGEMGDLHKEALLNPALFSLIGDVSRKKLLDAGCGEGYLSRLLARQGALVTGVDYSPRMLEHAKSRTPNELVIGYQHGNLEELDFLENDQFQLVVSNMVIQDLADYEKAFQEVYRVLEKDGYFIFSILHPCFVTPNSGWVKTEEGAKLYWKTDRYFYEGAYEQRIGEEEKMILFHRTLTSYINALVQTGFLIEEVVEPKPSEEVLMKYPSFGEDLRCADFLVFKVKK